MPRRGENIRKRKDGRWEGRYIKGYDSIKRKAKYASVYGKTYAETKQKLNEAKYKTSIGLVYIDSKNKRFGEILNNWLNLKQLNLKPSSMNKYQNLIENHIIPEIGHKKLYEINKNVLNQFLISQRQNGNLKNGKELSVSSIQSIQFILNSTIKYAAVNNLLPCFSVEYTIADHTRPIVQILKSDEEEKLDLFLSTHISRRNLGIMLSLYCGLRIGEVCALQWKDIDFENSTLHVRQTIQRISVSGCKKKTEIYLGSPKSKSSIRTIPLPNFILPIIKTISNEDQPNVFILTGLEEKPLEPRTFQYYFKKTLNKIGIEKKRYHTLRHTFATNCVALGFDIKSLSEILGHSNVSITLNKYVHPSIKQKKIQMEYWDNIKGQIYGQN